MLRRVETDERAHQSPAHEAPAAGLEHIVPALADSEFDGSLLPRDHPKWAKDAITVSQRARDLLTKWRPVVIAVLTFWDHRTRSAFIGGNRVAVDPTGSYRLE